MAKYALVIGLDRYDHFSNLKSAAKDAEAIAQLLERHQYQVTRLPRKLVSEHQWAIAPDKPLSQKELGKELKTFFQERAKHQEAVIYFAGHGFRVSDALTGEENGYLATSNATKEGQQAIPFDSLNKLMGQAELSSLVVMMDCCYAGSLLKEQRSLLEPTQTILSHKQNSCLIAACRDFERAREGQDHGIFTAAILKGLSAENAVQETVTSNDLFGFVERELKTSGQEVIHAGMGGAIDLVHYPKQKTTPVEKPATSARVFISYRSEPPDSELAEAFYQALKASGHEPFMAAESINWGENWVERIDEELKSCDYFLLLLSEQSALSDMVAGEVRTAKRLQDYLGKPVILPIRVDLPMDDPLNSELRSALQTIQQKSWHSAADTPNLIQSFLALIDSGDTPASVDAEIAIKPPSHERPPLPVADLELPSGTMPLDSKFYIKREPWDTRCLQEIENRGGLVRVKAPRQMGKTSLLARIRDRADSLGYQTVTLDFLETDENTFTDSSLFLKRLCALVSRRLGLAPRKVTEFWDEELFGPKENCTDYFEEYILSNVESSLFLGLDELDRLFPYEAVSKEFLTLLRSWNEKAKVNDTWAKLKLAIAHSTESYIVLESNVSPFNVGLAVELPELTAEQIMDLVCMHGLAWKSKDVEALMAMLGGHPYLIRLALYHVAKQDLTLSQLLKEAPTDAGIFGEHLRRHLWNLQQHPDLAKAFEQVIMSEIPITLRPMLAFKLNGMGLVDLQGNSVVLRHESLYRPYFHSRLRMMP